MDKDNYVKDYIEATKAYYLFMMGNLYGVSEWKDYILDSKYISFAKVSFISSIMLGIKEDIVKNCGELQYESKLFVNSLEKVVSVISINDGNNYLVDGFEFPDAASVVAIIRNKLAHGKYTIDYENNNILLRHKGQDIAIDIDRLIEFVMLGFMNMIKEQKNTEFVREICVFNQKESLNKKKLTVLSDVRNVIKNIHLVSFKLSSKNGKIISQNAINVLEDFIAYYKISPEVMLKSDLYKRAHTYFRKNGYELGIRSKSISNREAINEIEEMFSSQMKSLDMDYDDQIKLIMPEVERRLNSEYSNFDPLASNINQLIILQGISKTNSTDIDKISEYITSMGIDSLKFYYDELGVSILAFFNATFMYPLEDVFVSSGGYKLDRSLDFDFSSLDLSMLNPSIVSLNDSPKEIAFSKYNSLLKRKIDLEDKILNQKNNLNKVLNNPKAVTAIKSSISNFQRSYSLVVSDMINAKLEYDTICNDYMNNYDYFRNVSIIEGIRNAIAHGNYKFFGNANIMDTKIVFEDIYEGELTFKLEVTFNEFLEFLENNVGSVINYVSGKKKDKKL